MRFEIQQQRDGDWHTVGSPIEAATPLQAVAKGAPTHGYYRTRSLDSPEARFEYFMVPTRGAPLSSPGP
jgi:hypothetical protein